MATPKRKRPAPEAEPKEAAAGASKLTSKPPRSRVENRKAEQPAWVKKATGLAIAAFVLIAGIVVYTMFIADKGADIWVVNNPDEVTGRIVMNKEGSLDATHPFYTTTTVEFKKGDYVQISATGKVIGDPVLKGTANWVVGPDGVSYAPDQISPLRRPGQFRLKHAAMFSLIGAIGTGLEYNKRGEPKVVGGTKHFAIGSHLTFKAPCDGKLYLALNERWRRAAWNDNYGSVVVNTKVWRP